VTDGDFSYITAEDIARSQANKTAEDHARKTNRPSRDTDAILLKHRKISYPVHFPAYSIDDGELTIGAIRKSAAKKVDLLESQISRIKLFYRGKNLKDDARMAREEGMRSDSQAEILLVVGDQANVTRPESSGEEDETDDKPEKGKKRRIRRKKKSSKSPVPEETPSTARTYTGINPDATFAPGAAPLPPPKPAAPAKVMTPIQKLDTLASLFHTTMVPDSIRFLSHPPSDDAKCSFEHKKLTETILTQVLLKLDAVETEGDEEARTKRKALVKEVQGMLNQLDAVVKK